jgi:hypothetical protein
MSRPAEPELDAASRPCCGHAGSQQMPLPGPAARVLEAAFIHSEIQDPPFIDADRLSTRQGPGSIAAAAERWPRVVGDN